MQNRVVPLRLPHGVDKVIGFGSSSFIGRLDDEVVIKYPRVEGEQWDRFVTGSRIYTALGSHPRILTCYGLDERRLLLEYAKMGTVRHRLQYQNAAESITHAVRLKWCRQAAEAVAYIHEKNVIHCDISTRNFLLDQRQDLKLSDFQGIFVDPKGVTFNGFALENAKSFLPRSPTSIPNKKSDLFALGTAIYEIMTGHEPFPELDENNDEDEVEIEKRYTEQNFPILDGLLENRVIQKCWSLAYETSESCLEELAALEEREKAAL